MKEATDVVPQIDLEGKAVLGNQNHHCQKEPKALKKISLLQQKQPVQILKSLLKKRTKLQKDKKQQTKYVLINTSQTREYVPVVTLISISNQAM